MENDSFGHWLKLRRKALRLTQAELASRVYCSSELIRKIEADLRRPSREVAERLAKELMLPADAHARFVQVARAERRPDQLPVYEVGLPEAPASHHLSAHAAAAPRPALSAGTPQDTNRQRMIQKMRTFWVEGFLRQALQGRPPIPLHLEPVQDAVDHPWQHVGATPVDSYPEGGGGILEVFARSDGELLVLGEPGAGKTTLLLSLARHLLDEAEEEASLPVPVVFHLLTWAERRVPLAAWLVEELYCRYNVPRGVGAAWVADQQILPLLDGLDEVALGDRPACVAAINTFRQDHGPVSVVVCCREHDYRALPTRLALRGCVRLLPLDAAQVNAFFAGAGAELQGLQRVVSEDITLQEFTRSPLLLTTLARTYGGASAAVAPVSDLATWEDHLFGDYVGRMATRLRPHPPYALDQTCRWLAWLGRVLTHHTQALLLVEHLQPHWIEGRVRRFAYAAGVGAAVCALITPLFALSCLVIYGLAFGWPTGRFFGALDGAIYGVTFGLLMGWASYPREPDAQAPTLSRALAGGVGLGVGVALMLGLGVAPFYETAVVLAVALAHGVVAGTLGGLVLARQPALGSIAPVEILRWSWASAATMLPRRLPVSVLVGAVMGAVIGLANAAGWSTGWGWAFGLSIAIGGGLLTWSLLSFADGLEAGQIEARSIPNQGVLRAGRYAVMITIAVTIACGLIFGTAYAGVYALFARAGLVDVDWYLAFLFGLSHGPGIGILVGLHYGGLTAIQHLVLRAVLVASRTMPWRYVRFLEYAVSLALLRRVGGGFLFTHRRLQEYIMRTYGEAGQGS